MECSTVIHEKALKGDPKYHGASLGDARPANLNDTYTTTDRIDGRDSPILIFSFKYRSNRALKELLVIERTPEPEEDVEALIPGTEGLDPDQRRKVEAYLRNLKNGSGSQEDNKIKRERENNGESAHPNKRPKNSEEIECVDLRRD